MSSESLNEFIERIVREVIRRLRVESERAATVKPSHSHLVNDRLITASLIESIPKGTTEVTIAPRAILTPLARDEAKDRGIRIVRQVQG
jgi:hypothetical protein